MCEKAAGKIGGLGGGAVGVENGAFEGEVSAQLGGRGGEQGGGEAVGQCDRDVCRNGVRRIVGIAVCRCRGIAAMRRCLRGYGARWRRDGHPCGGYIVNR